MEWAIWLTVIVTMAVFPPTRWLVGLLWKVSLGLVALLLLSEPELD